MDNKTFGFKDPQIFWGGGYINEDGYTLFRFETQSGFDSFWNALRASTSRFVGNYFLNAEFEKGDDNYPDQLLSWRKDFEIWSEAHVSSAGREAYGELMAVLNLDKARLGGWFRGAPADPRKDRKSVADVLSLLDQLMEEFVAILTAADV
ncbi:hypothetical protein C5167_030980 [Papaver somniferum]|nr:hypothetical protein C5167_030980 [Papaver somniferum]